MSRWDRIEITAEMVEAAEAELYGDVTILSEDDNRYCNPPRTRSLTDEEQSAMVRSMIAAALRLS
jgi:hypothetical protein